MSLALTQWFAAACMRQVRRCGRCGYLIVIVFVGMLSPAFAQKTDGPAHFTDGHLGLGAGVTFQYDFNSTRTSGIGVVTWTWAADRFELAAFRFLNPQRHDAAALADSNWTLAASRRFNFVSEPNTKLFFGLGGAYKTETDDLNGSRLNFTEQLGWRVTHSEVEPGFELVLRHMSNAGLKPPNKGQDFLTVTYLF